MEPITSLCLNLYTPELDYIRIPNEVIVFYGDVLEINAYPFYCFKYDKSCKGLISTTFIPSKFSIFDFK